MQENTPLVSVVMAAYNAHAYIEETIDALRHQTYPHFEIIAVDDCSTDDTGALLDRLAQQEPRLIVVHNDVNLGAAESRNVAIARAKGFYIAINDADDLSLPDRFAKQVAFLEARPDYTFVGSLVSCFYDRSCPNGDGAYTTTEILEQNHFNYISKDGDFEKTAALIRHGMVETNRLCHSSVMGRAGAFKELKYKRVFAEDTEFFVRALLLGYTITKLPVCLVNYRIIGTGLSGTFSKCGIERALRDLRALDKEIFKTAVAVRNYAFLSRFFALRFKLYLSAHLRHKIGTFLMKHGLHPRTLIIRALSLIKKALPLPVLKFIRKLLSHILHYGIMRRVPLLSPLMFQITAVLNADPEVTGEKINGDTPCTTIGIWTIEKKWLMGGLYTILMMAAEILRKGGRVRFVNYGLHTESLIEEFLDCLGELYQLSAEDLARIELVYFLTYREKFELCHKDDQYIAGYWCPAEDIQNIHKKSDHFRHKKYAYIIQDYEPSMLYRWGSEYIRSFNTFLDTNYYPVFNNSLFVCGYLKKLGLITQWTPQQVLHGEPCKTEPPSPAKMKADADSIRLLFYARPTVDKNIYEIKIEALKRFIDALEKKSPQRLRSLKITGIGESAPSLSYKGVRIHNLGKLSYADYPAFIQDYNVGLSCIISPAFAYPCLEFPRAGLVTVVNRFETRDLEPYSGNIISCDNSADSICEKLLEAADRIQDIDARQKGSHFELPGVGIAEATESMLKFLDESC